MENASSNFKFLCDKCADTIAKTANVNDNVKTISRNVKTITNDISSLKTSLSDISALKTSLCELKKEVHDAVVNLPPPKSFEMMVDTLKDIKTTTISSAAAVTALQGTIERSPLSCGNEIVDLLNGIRDSLENGAKSNLAAADNNNHIMGMLTESRSNTNTMPKPLPYSSIPAY